MSQGTLFVLEQSARSQVVSALVKHYNLDFQIVEAKNSEEFGKSFPLKKTPALIGPKGFKLHETIAIAYYLINLIEDEKVKTTLLGKNNKEESEILKWVSLSNSDLASNLWAAILPTIGVVPFNKKAVDTGLTTVDQIADVFEQRLKEYTYLATENITLADIICVFYFAAGFGTLLDAKWRAAHPAITRWFKTISVESAARELLVDFQAIEEALKYVPPKKEKKEQPKKEQPKKEEAAPAAEAEQPKKPKHPLELLGKATFNLEDWKRKYSNEDTRPVALPWFWEHYNPEEYSIWKVGYKYNDELTLTFMSNNLVGGFFNRLSASVKYMFGCLVVYGENNNNGIVGAVMVRGQDFAPAFDVAPDWESYEYSKLDPSNEEDKEFINNMWAWDKPVVVNGENKEIADGKVLK